MSTSCDQLIYAVAQEGRLYDADTGHFCPTMHTILQPTVVTLSTFCFRPPVLALVLLHLLASSLRVIDISAFSVCCWVAGGKLGVSQQQSLVSLFSSFLHCT